MHMLNFISLLRFAPFSLQPFCMVRTTQHCDSTVKFPAYLNFTHISSTNGGNEGEGADVIYLKWMVVVYFGLFQAPTIEICPKGEWTTYIEFKAIRTIQWFAIWLKKPRYVDIKYTIHARSRTHTIQCHLSYSRIYHYANICRVSIETSNFKWHFCFNFIIKAKRRRRGRSSSRWTWRNLYRLMIHTLIYSVRITRIHLQKRQIQTEKWMFIKWGCEMVCKNHKIQWRWITE